MKCRSEGEDTLVTPCFIPHRSLSTKERNERTIAELASDGWIALEHIITIANRMTPLLQSKTKYLFKAWILFRSRLETREKQRLVQMEKFVFNPLLPGGRSQFQLFAVDATARSLGVVEIDRSIERLPQRLREVATKERLKGRKHGR